MGDYLLVGRSNHIDEDYCFVMFEAI